MKIVLTDWNLVGSEFIDNIEAALEIKVTDIAQLTVPEQTLETALRLFTYLTFCPPQELTLTPHLHYHYIF